MSDREDILALEKKRLAATLAVDIPALKEMHDDGLVYVHSTGTAEDKTAVFDTLEKKRHIVGLTRGDLNTVVWEGGAIISGPIHYRFRRPDGSEIAMSAFATQALKRTSQGWRFVSFQATPLKAP